MGCVEGDVLGQLSEIGHDVIDGRAVCRDGSICGSPFFPSTMWQGVVHVSDFREDFLHACNG